MFPAQLFAFLQNTLACTYYSLVLCFKKRRWHVALNLAAPFCPDFQIRDNTHLKYKEDGLFPTEHAGVRKMTNWPGGV